MIQEPTLAQLEDQEPQALEDLETELQDVNCNLGNARLLLRSLRSEEATLMTRRAWLRAQLRLHRAAQEPVVIRAEATPEFSPPPVFNGTTEPYCPDGVAGDE
jgi:hypothetical protein